MFEMISVALLSDKPEEDKEYIRELGHARP